MNIFICIGLANIRELDVEALIVKMKFMETYTRRIQRAYIYVQ